MSWFLAMNPKFIEVLWVNHWLGNIFIQWATPLAWLITPVNNDCHGFYLKWSLTLQVIMHTLSTACVVQYVLNTVLAVQNRCERHTDELVESVTSHASRVSVVSLYCIASRFHRNGIILCTLHAECGAISQIVCRWKNQPRWVRRRWWAHPH